MWSSIYYLLISVSGLVKLCSESFLLCEKVQAYSPLSFLPIYLVLCWSPRTIWSWVLIRVISMDLFRFFYMQPSCWSVSFVDNNFFFFSVWISGFFIKNYDIYHEVWIYNSVLCLGLQFKSFDQHVWFFPPIPHLFLLHQLCGKKLRSGMVIPSGVHLLFSIILVSLGFLCFHI